MQDTNRPVRPRRRIGNSTLCVTPLGFGGAPLGDLFERVGDDVADATVKAALDDGVRFFDTSPWYGHGLSEHRIGRALRSLPRDEFVLSTKVGRIFRRTEDLHSFKSPLWLGALPFDPVYDYSAAGVIRSYEDSLQRLGTNRVDCLVIHDLDPSNHPDADALARHRKQLESGGYDALAALRRRGEIGALGAGINTRDVMRYFLDRFELDFLLVAMPYTLLDQSPLHEEFAECRERGIGIVVGSPFASGILATGAIPGARYGYQPASEDMLAKTRRIEDVCRAFGVPLAAVALQFLLGHPSVAAVIPGALSPANAHANAANLAVTIPSALWAALKTQGLIDPAAPVPEASSS
jgi:D-threo-aldose 1-dehydrogenase